jgi:hypothetical protein
VAITGFSADSTANGASIVTTAKTGLSGATIDAECLIIDGTSARLNGSVAITKSQIFCVNSIVRSGSNEGGTGIISYVDSDDVSDTVETVSLEENSHVLVQTSANAGLLVTSLKDSAVTEEYTSESKCLVYIQPSGEAENCQLNGIRAIQFVGVPNSFAGVTLLDTLSGFLNWDSGRLDLIGINIPSTQSGYTGALGEGSTANRLYIWNPVSFDLSNLLLANSDSSVNGYKGFTATWRFIDASGNVDDAIVIYSDDRGGSTAEIARYTTGSDGILEGTVNSKNGSVTSSQDYPTLWILTEQTDRTGSNVNQSPDTVYTAPGKPWKEYTFTVDTISFTVDVRSYAHNPPTSFTSITEEIGEINTDESVAVYRPFLLLVDPGVTETNTTTVGAYSGISHALGSFTLSGSLNLEQVFDSRKLYWRNNDNIALPVLSGTTADFGALDITISTGGASPAAGAKFTALTTTGDITLSATGTYLNCDIPASGKVILGAAGTYDLSDFTFANGATIEADGITVTATVQAGQSITSSELNGASITIQTPQASLTASNVTDGTRYFAAHEQVFTVAAADVSTGANTITLGNDTNGDAPTFAGSSPYTTVKIAQTAGATLPTTSPQIIDGGRYYCTISGSAITLFSATGDISGSPITISAAGTDSGGSIFTLTAETELINQVVSGGVSEILTLNTGATILRKARYWSNSGTTTATPLFVQRLLWNATSGAADPQSVDPSVETDTIHERIISLTNLNLDGTIQNASGNSINSVTPTDDGSLLTSYGIALEGGKGKLQINSNDADGIAIWQDLYAWGVYVSSTEPGIRLVNADTFRALGLRTYDLKNLEVDNTSSTFLKVVGGIGRSSDGANLIADPQTGSGGIALNALSQGSGGVIETGTSGLTAGEASDLSGLAATLASSGVFSTASLVNAPGGGGGGDATEANQTTIIGHLTDIKGGTFSGATDSLEAIRDRGDAEWITATGFNTTTPPTAAAISSQIQSDLSTELGRIDAAISSRSSHGAPDLSNLDVAVSSRQASVTFPSNFDALAIDGTGQVTAGNMRGTDGANTTTPLDASATQAATAAALNAYDPPTRAEATADKDEILTEGAASWVTATGFSTLDAATVWAYVLTELSAVPTADTTAANMLRLLYLLARNRFTQTASTGTIYADDGTTAVATQATSDDGTTFTRGELS